MPIKEFLAYPNCSKFKQLLYSKGSMTSQLKSLGKQLSVSLINEGYQTHTYMRNSILSVDGCAVIIAQSFSRDPFFCDLLIQARTTPIGQLLFAPDSQVKRKPELTISHQALKQINNPILADYLQQHNYSTTQQFWLRQSQFNYEQQHLYLTEIILPEISNFFKL